ncbi:MAG: HEAT repeat domain-containing protein [Deltaproteobacteria bacterium]|nr:HEAT repeat domain-containing protein [Deltaproteobacteria bacterium]
MTASEGSRLSERTTTRSRARCTTVSQHAGRASVARHHTSTGARTRTVLVVAIAVVAAIVELVACDAVLAQGRTEYLVRMLRTSSQFRVRLQAALSLGALGDRAAVPALADALRDDEAAVRAAAAASLERLGDPNPTAITNLRALSRDPEASVQAAARRALRALEQAARASPSVPTTPTRPPAGGGGGGGGSSRYYVGLGNMGSKVSGVSAATLARLRDVMRANVSGMSGVVMAPDRESNGSATRVIRDRRLTGFYLDGALTSLGPSGGGLRAEVSVIVGTYPGRDIRVMLRGAATVQGVDISTASARQQAESQAIEAAVRSALRRLGGAFESSAATARAP